MDNVIVVNSELRLQPIGWVLLLLLAAGYAPQVSVQVFTSVIALWLMLASLPLAQAKQEEPRRVQPIATAGIISGRSV